MDRALVFGTSDGGSIPSGRTLFFGSVAQSVERSPLKRLVAGSNPAKPTLNFAAVLKLVYKHGLGPCGETHGGSSPLCGTLFRQIC